MAYTKNSTWADGSGGGTPVNAARLNHIEDGIVAAAQIADDAMTSTDPVNLAQMPPGFTLTIDYYQAYYGLANAWPSVHPAAAFPGIHSVWIGPSDPGSVMRAGDEFKLDAGA